ncbi:hypothetical protein L917_10755 [Phytophthora nicotianae]|uniref:Uncharacterized protein n=3 Tax=Phytophthora nicotianae TaxID=4792 RepID=V9EZT5_PHYNI|nr:hypothetical protein F443_11240 [Phytophthora nicotianae P1569]ETL90598.1 hypothetical protein L917_10755 [Phytophthora nicotianae]ETO72680.1 hypothetical protein F444_11298 [Phytophthora nicotianae P1976]
MSSQGISGTHTHPTGPFGYPGLPSSDFAKTSESIQGIQHTILTVEQ